MTISTSQPDFDLGALFSRAWKQFTENAGILIGGVLILSVGTTLLSLIGGTIATYVIPGFVPFGFLVRMAVGCVVGAAVAGPMMLGLAVTTLKIARGQKAEFGDVLSGFQSFAPALMVQLIISIGYAFCYLPGVIAQFLFCLAYFYMADRKLDYWPAMQTSLQTVTKSLGPWIVLYLVAVVLLNIAGTCACLVGLLVSTPMSLLILAMAYEQATGPTVEATPVP